MSKFPDDEAKILALGYEIVDGLTANTDTYPAPPLEPTVIKASMDEYVTARDTIVATQAALKQAVADKEAILTRLTDQMKKSLRYAENTVNYDDAKLRLIGWSGRKSKSPLAVPGQVRSLHIRSQGEGWISFTWKKPSDGGKPATYRIERREVGVEEWILAETVIEQTTTLRNQVRGKALEYRVVAMNKAGEGDESNTVTVTL